MRLGLCIPTLNAAPFLPSASFTTVLWQPVVKGRVHLDEFLRLRTMPGALHDGDDTTHTLEVTPGVAIPQVLGDRRRGIDPLFQPSPILLLRGVALRAR